jgi:hypothetical protein
MANFEGIQIKPPVTEREKREFSRYEREKNDKYEKEYSSDVALFGSYLKDVLRNREKFSETLLLNPNGTFNLEQQLNGNRSVLLDTAIRMENSMDGFYKLLKDIKEKFPNLEFKIESVDSQISFEVSNKIKIGDFVQWVNRGVNQFSEPKRIVHLSDDGQYGFFDGSMTGVPISELEVQFKN